MRSELSKGYTNGIHSLHIPSSSYHCDILRPHSKGKSTQSPLLLCASECLRRQCGKYFDTRAAIKAVKAQTITCRLVLKCLQTLNEPEKHSVVHLIRVSSHLGVEDKERADCLANRTAR